MVDASAAAVAPGEREDAFEDYADQLRHDRVLPGTAARPADGSAAGIADAYIFLGMGLSFLGQLAFNVLSVATDMAVERGIENAVTYLRERFRKGDPELPGEITDRVVSVGELPPDVDLQELRTVISIQVTVLVGEPAEDTADVPAESGPGGDPRTQ